MENETDKSASQILLEAAELLAEEGNWHKGEFFHAKEADPSKGCSMCAHGAIAYCGSQFIREQLKLGKYPYGFKDLGGAQLSLAHYKAKQVGLTYTFNDHPTTTKQDVINKLREAALLP